VLEELFLLTFIAGSPEYSYLMLPHRQLPLAILRWSSGFCGIGSKIEMLDVELTP
jgi:hypothetical protein